MSEIKSKNIIKSFGFRYSCLYACFAFASFMWMWLNGRGFMWVHDGYSQHYKALMFYGQYLRDAIHSIFTGQISQIPSWSYYLGEGGDILGVLNYYVIGDPLNILSVFFSPEYTHVLYDLLSLLRLYLAGLSFAYLCGILGHDKNSWSVVGGSLSYTFSMWAIHNAGVQVMFLSPLYILPLLIAGVELVIRRKKGITFILSVFLAAITNFYFFYNEVLFVVVYVIVRLIVLYKRNISEYVRVVISLLWRSIIGVLMSGVILLPSLIAFLGDKRSDVVFHFKLFYPQFYYLNLPAMLVSSVDNAYLFQCYLSLSALGIIALCLLFFTPKRKELKVFSILSLLFVIFPIFGRVFNGMSYFSGKWTFAVTLLVSYLIVVMWGEFKDLYSTFNNKHISLFVVTGVLFLAVLVIEESRIPRSICGCVLLILSVLTLEFAFKKVPEKYRDGCLIGIIFIGVAISSFWLNSIAGDNYGAQTRTPAEISHDNTVNELSAINAVCNTGDSYYRYSAPDGNRNLGLISDKSSIGYFWTLSNPCIVDFNMGLGMNEYKIYEYTDYDARTIPLTVSSTLYYVTHEAQSLVPYGFDYIGDYGEAEEQYYVYRNSNCLGESYSLDRYVPQSEWDKLNPVQRESLLLSGIIVEDADVSMLEEFGLERAPVISATEEISYELSYDENDINIDPETETITVINSGAMMQLDFESIPNTELYIEILGLSRIDDSDGYIVIRTDGMPVYVQEFYSEGYDFYNGRENYVKNLGYSNEVRNSIKLFFVLPGTYRLGDINIYCQDLSSTTEYIDELNAVALTDMHMDSDCITGTCVSDEARLLVMSVPYHEGWSAYIDGEEVSIVRANLKYMGVLVPAGEHKVEFVYHTPYLFEGLIISIIGFISFICVIIFLNKKRA